MKKNINTYIVTTVVLITIFTYISVYLFFSLKEEVNFFGLDNMLLFTIIILLSVIISTRISKKIYSPLRKIRKNLTNFIQGDNTVYKVRTKITDINDLSSVYMSAIDFMKRSNFDTNSQKSKTEIILEHMADGVIGFSTKGDIVHINKSAMNLLEIDDNYKSFENIINKFKLNVKFEQIIYLPRYKCIEHRFNISDNIIKLVLVPFFDNNNIPMGVLLIARNITENIRLDNMRKEFVSNVSHEFKTPLTSIKGYSETMLQNNLTKEEVFDFAKVINSEAIRMDKLVKDLLQLSKLDYKKNNIKKIEFSLSDLMKFSLKKLQYSANQREHKLESIIEDNVKIYSDKDSIEQIVLNIVSNSIKYTPDGGNIIIKVNKDDKKAYIIIQDNGIGISKKDLERIYERFYRVDKARTRKMGGTGLGLSIVKEMLEVIGGEIAIESEVNKGTKTTISLPLVK